jgi:16S rRNA (guanine966-N2)-methyltransferase
MKPARPHEVRVIGGRWKRSKLPVADLPGLRPTPDRVRETLFNWLGQDLGGWRVLDAFAGSGALGFEAASRGAAEVVLLEREPKLVALLKAAKQRLQADTLRVERTDAPFDAGLTMPALAAALPLVRQTGFIYVEAAAPLAEAPAGWELRRTARAGAVHFHLLHRGYTAAVETPRTAP